MKVHLVHAHSESDSFVAAMRDTIIAAFTSRGDTVTVSDLYAMNFNPVSGPHDFGQRADPEHLTYALEQRHGFKTGTLAPDILAEIAKIQVADIVGFTFPLYWFGVPAILKGWIERVFISGTFYGGKRPAAPASPAPAARAGWPVSAPFLPSASVVATICSARTASMANLQWA